MKLLRKTLTLALLIAFTIQGYIAPIEVEAAFVLLECISGECDINVFGQDNDFTKVFPESNPSVRLRVKPSLFRAPESTEDSFSYRAYEINGLGQKEVISKTYVKFPKAKKNLKDYQLDLPLVPFTGSKTIYIEWYSSNDKLLLTNSVDLRAEGVFASNLAQSVNPNYDSVKETVMDFLVNNVRWNAKTRGDSKVISVIPDNDNKVLEVNIPVSRPNVNRTSIKRKKLRYGSNGDVNYDSETLNTNPGIEDDLISTDSQIIVRDGDVMAVTSSVNPAVPILVIGSNRRLGINEDTPLATLDIAPGDNTEELPIMRFRPSPLPSSLTEGAFEFDNSGDLYFTSNNTRRNFVFNPDGDDSVKKLQSSTDTAKFTTYTGNFNTVLNSQAELTNLNLPAANGTIARLEDLVGLTPGTGTVDTDELVDGSVTNPKLAPDAVTTDKILDGTITASDLDSSVLNSLDEALRLKSSSVGATNEAVTFEGLNYNAKFILNGSSTADLNLTLPEGDGTLARLSDITSPGPGTIGTAELADGSVTNPKLAPDAVTTDKILDGEVGTADLADDAVTTSKITDGHVTVLKLATDSVNSDKVIDGSLTGADIQDASLTAADLATGSVTTDEILNGTILGIDVAPNTLTGANIFDGSITDLDLASNSVTTDKITDGHVTVLKLATDSVNSDKVIDNSLTAADLATGSVTSDEILDGTITASDLDSSVLNSLDEALRLKSINGGATTEAITFDGLNNAVFISNGSDVNLTLPAGDGTLARLSDITAPGPGTIGTAQLAVGSVTNPKLAPDAVTTDKILDGEVETADLADNAVTTSKITDGHVTVLKLASDSVNSDKIIDGSIQIADLDPSVLASVIPGPGSVTNVTLADNSVTSIKIQNGSVLTADLADGSVTNPKLANNAVTTDKIQDGTIQTVDLADASITPVKILDGAVDSDKILDNSIQIVDLHPSVLSSVIPAPGSITNVELANNSVTSVKIVDGEVKNADIDDDAVTTDKILDGGIQTIDLADGSVTAIKLANNSVTSPKIVDGEVKNADIDDDAVTTDKIQDGTILVVDLDPTVLNSLNVPDGSITTVKLANNAVTTAKIANNAITSIKINDGSVNTDDLANLGVTTAKLADLSVTSQKLAPAAVTVTKIADLSINANKIQVSAVNSSHIFDGTITSNDLANVSVTTQKIANNSVTSNKITNGTILPEDLHPGTLGSISVGPGSITSIEIADNSVTTNDIQDGTIQTADLANGSVTNVKLAPDAVTTDKVLDETLTGDDIQDGSITASDLAPGAIPSLTTDKGTLSGTVIDFTAQHSFFTKVMTANTTFSATNLQQGHRYLLRLSGDFVPTFPSYFVEVDHWYYFSGSENIVELEVLDDNPSNPYVTLRYRHIH